MKRSIQASFFATLSVAFAVGSAGCGDFDQADEADTDGNVATQGDRLAHRRRHGGVPRANATPVVTGSSSSGASVASVPATNADAIVAAAQTPDGRAIPQGSGPGGQCPDVVALLGFWSCIQSGDTCTFQSAGMNHHCTCKRVDGEGQLPAWSCD